MSSVPDPLQLLACPTCHGALERGGDRLRCPACRLEYQHRAQNIWDFGVEERTSGAEAICWDGAADQDEVYASAAIRKDQADGIFTKMPTALSKLDLAGKVYLDLGCGYGRTLLYSMVHGHPQVGIGVDISMSMLAKNRAYAGQYAVAPVLLHADVSRLPVRAGVIDQVYSSAVLLHVPKDKVRAALEAVFAILKPGGVATFEGSFPGWLNPDGVQTKLMTTLGRSWLEPAWVRTYTAGEVDAMVRDVGFRDVDIVPESYKILPKGLFKLPFPGPIKRVVNRINRSVSASMAFRNAFVAGWRVTLRK